jgi:L-asparagine transporter-like permease
MPSATKGAVSQRQVVSRTYGTSDSGPPKANIGSGTLTLLTLGGVMGSGLFLASAQAIHLAGPGVIVAYAIGASVMALEIMALAEMSAADPAQGSFLTYARRSIGNAPAFIGGWIFWFSSVLNLAAEATAVGTFARLWFPHAPLYVFSMGVAAVITALNFLPIRNFDTVESSMSILKITAIALFVVVGGLALSGLVRHGPAPGLTAAGGFFPKGVTGIGAAMTVVMFSMAGTGVLGLAASSVKEPGRSIPRAIGPSVFTIAIFYILSALVIAGLTPWSSLSTAESPFVKALGTLPWSWAPSVLNAVLIVAVLSAMNAGLFATDRILASLSRMGDAPRMLQPAKGGGAPTIANAVTGFGVLVVAGVSYLLPKTAFLMLVTATSYQALFIWLLIVVTQIFYRRWLERHEPERLRYRVPLYPYLSWFEVALILAIIATAPLGPNQVTSLGIAVGATVLIALCYLPVRAARGRPAARPA